MRSRLAILLPVVNLIWIVVFLANYSNVWVAPEANAWREHLVPNRTVTESLVSTFNWPVFEREPRLSRPLSSFVEIVDNSIRKVLWRRWTPHPTLSLTYIFTLVVSPILLYGVLRKLGAREDIACCGVALYLANPGVLSLLAMGFRPGKAMACTATIFVLWLASRFVDLTIWRLAALYGCLFLSFFLDEIALIAYPALLLLFPRVIFSNRKSAIVFFLMPIAYVASVRWTLPAVHAFAGFPVPIGASYGPLERFKDLITFATRGGARPEFREHLGINSSIALTDSMGLINPFLANDWVYSLIFGGIVLGLGALAVLLVRRQFLKRIEPKPLTVGRTVVLRSVAFLLVCLIFHEALLSAVEQHTWGLYWYGAFVALGVVVTLALLLEYLNAPALLSAALTVFISAGSFYIFPATNDAYRNFHWYPYRPQLLRFVFQNEINRFDLAGPRFRHQDMKRYTEILTRNTDASLDFMPAELLYVVYELGLKSGEGCGVNHPTFTLVRRSGASHLECHEALVGEEDEKGFLGTWMTPSAITVIPAAEFVAIEAGVPNVAHIAGTRIEVGADKRTGQLSVDGRTIAWSNGALWERRSGELSSFEGTWWFEGTRIIRKARSSDVLLGEETRPGMIQPGGSILSPSQNLAGSLSSDRRRILWTDGTVWTR